MADPIEVFYSYSNVDDLDEAREIAEAGGMRLYLADVLLGETRLALARG